MTIWAIIRVNHRSMIGRKYVGHYTMIKCFKKYDDASVHVVKLLDDWQVKHRKREFHYEIVETELS